MGIETEQIKKIKEVLNDFETNEKMETYQALAKISVILN